MEVYRGYDTNGETMTEITESEYKRLKRAFYLLRPMKELLQKQANSSIVLDICCEIVHYDDADCDGYCLLDDINEVIGEE